jgi:hypothetical protein
LLQKPVTKYQYPAFSTAKILREPAGEGTFFAFDNGTESLANDKPIN